MLKNTIIVRGENVKRIAITCKCGHRFVHMVPGEVIMGGAIPIFNCPQCQQGYVIRENGLQRIPDLHALIGLKDPDPAAKKPDAEFGDERTVDSQAWSMPESKLVN